MRIFFRYLFKNMTEKKSRLFLLVFSIAISTMLLVSSVGVVEVILGSHSSAYTIGNEGMGIVITSTENTFYNSNDVDMIGVDDCSGEIYYTGIMSHDNDDTEMVYVNLRGKEKNQISDNYNDYILEGNVDKLKDETCIISKRTSDEYDIHIDDRLTVSVNGNKVMFKVVGICANTGLYYMDQSSQFSIIVSYEYLADYFEADGKYNVLFAKPEEDTISESIDAFTEANEDSGFKAESLYDDEAINEEYSSFLISMYAMLGIVIIMCFVIINGAFTLILNERLSTIGTFLSQGATRGRIKSLLYFESIFYGLCGGVIGDALGMVVLMIINRITSPLAEYGIIEKFSINTIYLVMGIIFAVILSFLSAVLPVRNINKLPIKEVILNSFYVPVKIGWSKFVLGAIMIIISFAGAFISSKWTVSMSPVLSFFAILGIVLASTKFVDLVTNLICKVIKNKSGVIFLAFNNLRTSRVLLSNVTLIIVAMISSIIISGVSESLINSLEAAYQELDYDISISNILEDSNEESTTDLIVDELRSLYIVEEDSINPYYKVTGSIDNIKTAIHGVDPEAYRNYLAYLELDSVENKEMYDAFVEAYEEEIILSDRIIEKLDKKVGDKIILEINNIEHQFTIAGQIDGKMYDSGAFAIIKSEIMTEVFEVNEASFITISVTADTDIAKVRINTAIFDYGATCTTKSEEVSTKIETMATLCQTLIIFSRLIIIIAVFGIINNMLVGLIQRKKELALLSSIGMSSASRNIMLITESVITVLGATLLIVPYSYIIAMVVTKFMDWAGLAVKVTLNPENVLLTVAITFVSVLLTSIPVLIKSRKISTIDELRYE